MSSFRYLFGQEEIHELLLNFAEAGATVVRLKGGDPLVSIFQTNFLLICSSCDIYMEFWFILGFEHGYVGFWERWGGDGFSATARNSSTSYTR